MNLLCKGFFFLRKKVPYSEALFTWGRKEYFYINANFEFNYYSDETLLFEHFFYSFKMFYNCFCFLNAILCIFYINHVDLKTILLKFKFLFIWFFYEKVLNIFVKRKNITYLFLLTCMWIISFYSRMNVLWNLVLLKE